MLLRKSLPDDFSLALCQTETEGFLIRSTQIYDLPRDLVVTWRKNGKKVKESDKIRTSTLDGYFILKISDYDETVEGKYNCIIQTRERTIESNIIKLKIDEFIDRSCLLNVLICCMLLQSEYKMRLHEDVSINESLTALSVLFKLKDHPSLQSLKDIASSETDIFHVQNDIISFKTKAEEEKQLEIYTSWDGFLDIFIKHSELENIKDYCRQELRREELAPVIERMGYDFVIHYPLPDPSQFAFISAKLKIPEEVLLMGKNDRENFVRDLKIGGTQVFHGQGMLVGWAGAGKTTLIKKLKGDRDLTTTQTKSLEIQQNLFKMDIEGGQLKVCLLHEKEGPALNMSIRSLKSQNDLKESQNNQKENDLAAIKIHEEPKQISQTTSTSSKVVDDKEESTQVISSSSSSNPQNACTSHTENELSSNVLPKNIRVQPQKMEEEDEKFSLTIQEKDLKIVTILDFGGQSVYYACHHVYLSPRAFYILVVDYSKDFYSKAKEVCEIADLIYSDWRYIDYIRYWMSSIHTFGSVNAPVIIVASHTEKIPKERQKEEMNSLCEKIMNDLPDPLRIHIKNDRIFAVSKLSNKNLKEINGTIVKILKDQLHWGKLIPTSWLRLEVNMRNIKKEVIRALDLWEEIKRNTSIGIDSQNDLLTALKFFHEMKIILFTTTKPASEFIILNVQWFIDAFQCIIDPESPARLDSKCCGKWKDFTKTGLLTKDLLESMWQRKQTYIDHETPLLHYMTRFGLLAEVGDKIWYVPCMNKQTFEEGEILQNCTMSSTLCFAFEFLPVVIFFQLVTHCINNCGWKVWKRQLECVYHTAVILEHKSSLSHVLHKIIIKYSDKNTSFFSGENLHYSIEIRVFVLENNKLDSSLVTEVRDGIQRFLQTVSSESTDRHMKFRVGIRCRNIIGKESSILPEEFFLDSRGKVECSGCKDRAHTVECDNLYTIWNSKEKEDHVFKAVGKYGEVKCEYRLLEKVTELEKIEIDVEEIHHITCKYSNSIWISDLDNRFLQINSTGKILSEIKCDAYTTGLTMNENNELLFTDPEERSVQKAKDNGSIRLLSRTGDWVPRCIHSSRFTENIFVGLTRKIENEKLVEEEAKILRYEKTGNRILQEIQWNAEHKPLYRFPHHIAENSEGKIFASDYHLRMLIAVDKYANLEFNFKTDDFWPHGVIVDYVGNVLVCNASYKSSGVLVLDQMGNILAKILTRNDNVRNVRNICVDDANKLYLIQKNANMIRVFKYLERI
ncbi:uncharacterized protein LOC133189767 [Saccostrea echinata]|uniref:uncharacterized protein LOC133189767 n=1 Tax=Saccostrea echinata TaxID=191078 RepID=UPI002A7F1B6C|nr:uncharacterized protein LOC133189767 [Saccostrea echinata]